MKKNAQAGFTLLEVLIALLVLAVGLLGMASLTVHSMQTNQSAYLRSQASVLAYDIADRMRANHEGAVNTSTYTATSANTPSCSGGCSPAEQAQADVAEWRAALQSTMPGATATITRSTADGVIYSYQITINWTDSGASDISSSSFTLRVDI